MVDKPLSPEERAEADARKAASAAGEISSPAAAPLASLPPAKPSFSPSSVLPVTSSSANETRSLSNPASSTSQQDSYPAAVAFYFSVTVLDGAKSDSDAAFQDVSGLSAEMDTEVFVEGGGNNFSYRLPKGVKYQNLVLSRGMAPASSELVKWCLRTFEGGLARPIETKALRVSLLGPEEKILHSWSFAGAYPVKWQAESFNSQKNDVAIEKIELAFNRLTRETV